MCEGNSLSQLSALDISDSEFMSTRGVLGTGVFVSVCVPVYVYVFLLVLGHLVVGIFLF